ncbi:hypothetical protein Pmani_008883 [Petrolisthes manimaculis]|uniref:Uncharacterized protein n=1 Tax=Petrolisthes manimaculis TaxID=1843537 RepID=A0AAE1Q843_9EUCA|nr:hypothetical protein Pmani_008883 [Petrolisthes manimaculis]
MSRRGSDNGDATKSHSEGGGPTINGSIEAMLTPELLFRMNKKIAQLTKRVSQIFGSGAGKVSFVGHMYQGQGQ